MGEAQRYVWLNNSELPIKGAVSWHRVTPFPTQFTTSRPEESDYTPTRKQRWGNLRGGMGKDKWSPRDNDRYADASIDPSQEIQTLPSLITTMENSEGMGFGKEPIKIIKHDGKIWAIGHNQISYWTGSAWSSVKNDFSNPTDAILFYGAVL